MNSSVTVDSAISVTSSLCLLISCSSRSNGPSKLVSRTVKRAGATAHALRVEGPPAGSRREHASGGGQEGAFSLTAESPHEDRVVPALPQVGEDDGDRLADDAPAVGGQPVLTAQRQPRRLQREQLVGGDVDGDLLVVLGAVGTPRGPAPGGDDGLHRRLRQRPERRH